MAYLEWGDPRNRDVLVCVHGLTRTARDFDEVARALCGQLRVVCPDVAGRGDSDPLPDPSLYGVPQYLADMVTLIARLDVESVHWVGTSMGALIGIALAAQQNTPIQRFVINDAGPVVSKVSLERIASYVGKAPTFPNIEAAEQYVRTVSAPFGPHTDAEWRFLTEVVMRKNPDGTLRVHYDPRLAEPFRATMPERDMELWPLWDAVRCPTLVLAGDDDPVTPLESAEEIVAHLPSELVRFERFAGARHGVHRDEPEACFRVLREFLAG